MQFASETEAERALKTKNHQHMGQRYIECALALCLTQCGYSLAGQGGRQMRMPKCGGNLGR